MAARPERLEPAPRPEKAARPGAAEAAAVRAALAARAGAERAPARAARVEAAEHRFRRASAVYRPPVSAKRRFPKSTSMSRGLRRPARPRTSRPAEICKLRSTRPNPATKLFWKRARPTAVRSH